MAAKLEQWARNGSIPKYTLWNKRNPSADPVQCGIFRPDFVYQWAEGVLILEYNEQMHSDRNKRCKLARMAQASMGYGARPVHWIRFDPGAFKVDRTTLHTTAAKREDCSLHC